MNGIRHLTAGGFALAICLAAPATAQELRFTVWTGNDAHLAMLNGIADTFRETHPDVTVRFETIPAADYTQKLTFQLAGGNIPDLGWIMEDAAPAFINAGVLEDVGEALRADADYDYGDFSEPAMGLWVDGDAVYGIPFSTSPLLIFYNKTMFDEAGVETPMELAQKGEWTLDKFQEVSKLLAEADNGAYGFEFKDGQGYDARMMHAIMPSIRANGGFAWRDGKCGFSEPEAIAAVKQLHDMIHVDHSIVPPGEQGDFFSGGAAMTVSQISRASKLAEGPFEWGLAPLPAGSAGESPAIGQAGIAVFAQGKNKEVATEFLAHMTNEENVKIMAQFFPPARKSILNSPDFVESNALIPPEQMAVVADAIANGSILPSHEKLPQIEAAMKPRMDTYWRPDADVEKAMADVCAVVTPQL
ncbi:sugar ABC transporter substrate-binding protein [Pseudoruegeria sp. HB172150]|uniref:ABC transporter substrate-binding protein n=1 Tax=Pseudoruegeria sp. HB172150 TaxID=2721164 RepID=UPI0015582DB9|nr:sugar ABC transporter substrate-binding protein [Pseudoruegeria sp. HB172150]